MDMELEMRDISRKWVAIIGAALAIPALALFLIHLLGGL